MNVRWVARYRELEKAKRFLRIGIEPFHAEDAPIPGIEPDGTKFPTVWIVCVDVQEGQDFSDRAIAREACNAELLRRFPGADIGGNAASGTKNGRPDRTAFFVERQGRPAAFFLAPRSPSARQLSRRCLPFRHQRLQIPPLLPR